MSIWGSGIDCGEDDDDERDGSVLNYISGFSNHYPNTPHGMEGRRETTACVGTASIPPWCVPGFFDRDDLDNGEAAGQWLRLDVVHNPVSIWSGEFEVGEQDVTSVVMREDAVRKLRDSLTEWLEIPKLDGAS